jgi:hydroxymethylbilane synthase
MKIGTRGSDLALWQARLVRALLQQKAGIDAELVIIRTQGDRDQKATFEKMEGKGFFTKEIEAALLDKTVDLAVHSLKDLQTTMPDGLALGAVLHRADRRDLLLSQPDAVDDSRLLRLREGATVGTTSARRVAQLCFLRPDLNVVPLRGNVPTRLNKLREGRYDAILVAAAGIDRLELSLDGLAAYRLPENLLVPAPGQGALAIQIRDQDPQAALAASALNETPVREAVWLEREILKRLEGGCQLPLGTAADRTPRGYRLRAFLGSDDPERPKQIVVAGTDRHAVAARTVAYLTGERLVAQNADPVRTWITRSPERASEYANALDGSRTELSALPVFVAVDAGEPDVHKRTFAHLESYNWIIFTSQITVTQFSALLKKHDCALPPATRLAAIGKKTARAMRREGWDVHFISAVADARSLAEAFLEQATGESPESLRLLFPCSAKATRDLETTLESGKISLERMVCYDTVEHPDLSATLEALPDPQIVVFTSPSAAAFVLNRRDLPEDTTVISIGPATTAALLERGFPIVYEAANRTMEGLAEVTHELIAD